MPEPNRPIRYPRPPWWFLFVHAGVELWRLAVPAAVVLLLVGWYGADWLGGFRWVVFATAILVALPSLAAAILYVVQTINAKRNWRTLDREEAVAEIRLPANSRLHFVDKTHTRLISIDLPEVTEILGMRLVGRLGRYETWDDIGPVWSGTLAEDQAVQGIPCRAGYFTFDKFGTIFDSHGTVHKFGLAAEHDFFGLTFPPGTAVRRGNAKRYWHFLLPADRGVHIPALATMAPGGVTLTIADDGRLDHIDSGHGQTIVVRGVPLNSKSFRLQDDDVVSELAEPFLIAGAMRQAGSAVQINLSTGQVSLRK